MSEPEAVIWIAWAAVALIVAAAWGGYRWVLAHPHAVRQRQPTFNLAVMAQPGDGDLIFDVKGTRIDYWSNLDRDFIVQLTGGTGWAWNGRVIEWDTVTKVTYQFGVNSAHVAAYEERLTEWSDGRTLRLVAARGRMSSLSADGTDPLPLPLTT